VQYIFTTHSIPTDFLMLAHRRAPITRPTFRTFDRKARIYQSSPAPGEVRLLPRLSSAACFVHEQAARRCGRPAPARC